MNEPSQRFLEIFFEVYEALPRQGPGSHDCAARVLRLCKRLPHSPVVLDLGCGVGGQTLQLAELTSGSITAIDNHAPSIERLQKILTERGLSQRVQARLAIWLIQGNCRKVSISSGPKALSTTLGLGTPSASVVGCCAPGVTWPSPTQSDREENPPPEVKASFDHDYPTMGWVNDVVSEIHACKFELVAHFSLPDEAWWGDFYTPMETRIAELGGKYTDDHEASAILDQLAETPNASPLFKLLCL